ncbi:hypothetical protein BDV27DRAFT_24412 [Aspergillus caelatus]|uniref:Uncharacterized protein n=1 Tax=Aspergillus caelatus TaxID=61420 RepID=A0A5N7AIH0_9EURO|nr:uncharacterized protein BDV27DRAFT_24412 [Aspergillus caelatus]KAE8368988.1 hypothetical protein BDV27DRAFT_24412 [Aspergillus caelatus]
MPMCHTTIHGSLTSEVCLEFEWQYYLKRNAAQLMSVVTKGSPRHVEVVAFHTFTLTVTLSYVIFLCPKPAFITRFPAWRLPHVAPI